MKRIEQEDLLQESFACVADNTSELFRFACQSAESSYLPLDSEHQKLPSQPHRQVGMTDKGWDANWTRLLFLFMLQRRVKQFLEAAKLRRGKLSK